MSKVTICRDLPGNVGRTCNECWDCLTSKCSKWKDEGFKSDIKCYKYRFYFGCLRKCLGFVRELMKFFKVKCSEDIFIWHLVEYAGRWDYSSLRELIEVEKKRFVCIEREEV